MDSEFYKKYKSKGLVVLGMNQGGNKKTDSVDDVRRFVKQAGLTFPILLGAGPVYSGYRLDERSAPFPVHVLIDKEGKIAYIASRYDKNALKQKVEELMGK